MRCGMDKRNKGYRMGKLGIQIEGWGNDSFVP